MPQLDFLLSDVEMRNLVSLSIDLGCTWVPGVLYSSNEYVELHELDDVVQAAAHEPMWYVLHGSYIRCPLKMFYLDSGPARGMHSILQRHGGPCIDIFWSGEREKDNVRFIRMGDISYYPFCYHSVTEEEMTPPDSLRELYKVLTSWVRKHSVLNKRERGERRVYIGHRAASLWAQHGIQLGWHHWKCEPERMPPSWRS